MPEIEPVDTSLKNLTGRHLWHAPLSSCSQRVRIVLAELDEPYESHLLNMEQDEHATPAYQAIHPKGLVPAYVEDGHLFIESVDIIDQIARQAGGLAASNSAHLLKLADDAQMDLKLLTFEFLFRSGKPASKDRSEAFQANHNNDWLKQFRLDFAAGFDRQRLDAAVSRIDEGFKHLDHVLSDGREFLGGPEFSISDVAWMPNVHRFNLMDWPFERTPNLLAWFERVSRRSSYRQGLLKWQPEAVEEKFAAYTQLRREQSSDVRCYGPLAHS